MRTKIIHYCWFGYGEKSNLIKKCMESWHIYAPDYEIREWNEDNFDIHLCKYMEEAYAAKKWAFVSDYCRFWVLYQYGGLYLDTDVELIRNIDDLPDSFIGFENQSTCNSGLIRGACAGDKICQFMLDSYHSDRFALNDGCMNLKTVCLRETNILKNLGLKSNNTLQVIENTTVYPTEYFCPLDFHTNKLSITPNTYSIHHYYGSWHSEREEYAKKLGYKLNKFMPIFLSRKAAFLASMLKYQGLRSTSGYIYKRTTRK